MLTLRGRSCENLCICVTSVHCTVHSFRDRVLVPVFATRWPNITFGVITYAYVLLMLGLNPNKCPFHFTVHRFRDTVLLPVFATRWPDSALDVKRRLYV